MRDRARTPIANIVVTLALIVLAAATIVGLVLLWPEGGSNANLSIPVPETVEAEVAAVAAAECQNPAEVDCVQVEVDLQSGPDEGTTTTIALGEFAPDVNEGDDVRVTRTEAVPTEPSSLPNDTPESLPAQYSISEFERRGPMLLLLAVFVALVVALGRWRGVRSLIGLGASLALIVFFVIPAILENEPPLLVALVGSMAVMLTTIGLAHGVGIKSRAAALGTAVSLVVTVGLALVFTDLAHLFGNTSEEANLLAAGNPGLSLHGLVLAAMVIGALGVLDDVTVSQASTVLALRRADPTLRFGSLYREAISVGKDHVAATVNTLVLAYVGASLPILLVFAVGDVGLVDAANREAVAEQVVATLVGSIGLIAAVPITTALAAVLAGATPSESLAADEAVPHSH